MHYATSQHKSSNLFIPVQSTIEIMLSFCEKCHKMSPRWGWMRGGGGEEEQVIFLSDWYLIRIGLNNRCENLKHSPRTTEGVPSVCQYPPTRTIRRVIRAHTDMPLSEILSKKIGRETRNRLGISNTKTSSISTLSARFSYSSSTPLLSSINREAL